MSEQKEDLGRLPVGDFRIERCYLAAHVFAWPEDAEPNRPADDMVGQKTWRERLNLPTDVLLRTTSYAGSAVERLTALLNAWQSDGFDTFAEIEDLPVCFLRSYEELEAALFTALHGYYRPALSCLRTAVENMASGTVAWLEAREIDGSSTLKWSPALRKAREAMQPLTRREREVVMGGNRGSLFTDVYDELSGFVHGEAGAASGDLWRSNGPIFAPEALEQFSALFENTLVLLYVLRGLFGDGLPISSAVSQLLRDLDENDLLLGGSAGQRSAAIIGIIAVSGVRSASRLLKLMGGRATSPGIAAARSVGSSGRST